MQRGPRFRPHSGWILCPGIQRLVNKRPEIRVSAAGDVGNFIGLGGQFGHNRSRDVMLQVFVCGPYWNMHPGRAILFKPSK
jgi:hypothetical protein